jgi:hypothetical protein
MRLAKTYSQERLEAACARALAFKAYSYGSVKSILKIGLDKNNVIPIENVTELAPSFPVPSKTSPGTSLHHCNIRGKEYFQKKEVDNA